MARNIALNSPTRGQNFVVPIDDDVFNNVPSQKKINVILSILEVLVLEQRKSSYCIWCFELFLASSVPEAASSPSGRVAGPFFGSFVSRIE